MNVPEDLEEAVRFVPVMMMMLFMIISDGCSDLVPAVTWDQSMGVDRQ